MDINYTGIIILEDGRTIPAHTKAANEDDAKVSIAKCWLLDKCGSNNIIDIVVAKSEYTIFVTR